jgi:hypothetical protein
LGQLNKVPTPLFFPNRLEPFPLRSYSSSQPYRNRSGSLSPFAWLIDFVKTNSLLNPNNVAKAQGRSFQLADALGKLSAILAEDRKVKRFRQEWEEVVGFTRQLEKLTQAQKAVRAKTEKDKISLKELRLAQTEVLWQTRQLARLIGPQSRAVRARMEIASRDQSQAEKDLVQKKPKEALQNQNKAVRGLEDAGKELNKFLEQRRAVGLVYLLKMLEQRCHIIREMQKSVREATIALEKAVAKNQNKKTTRANRQEAAKLGEKQSAIVAEATDLILAVAANGSVEGFVEVLRQIRTDLEEVQNLLEHVRVDHPTQEIEKEIIEILEEIIKVLKEEQAKKRPKGVTIPELEDPKLNKTITELRNRLRKMASGQRRISQLIPGALTGPLLDHSYNRDNK